LGAPVCHTINEINFMESQILTDPKVKPEKGVLEKTLGKNYNRYEEFVNKINAKSLIVEWNYYNDGKSWLGKILNDGIKILEYKMQLK